MKEPSDIELRKAFQERYKDFQAPLPDNAWDEISVKLSGSHRKSGFSKSFFNAVLAISFTASMTGSISMTQALPDQDLVSADLQHEETPRLNGTMRPEAFSEGSVKRRINTTNKNNSTMVDDSRDKTSSLLPTNTDSPFFTGKTVSRKSVPDGSTPLKNSYAYSPFRISEPAGPQDDALTKYIVDKGTTNNNASITGPTLYAKPNGTTGQFQVGAVSTIKELNTPYSENLELLTFLPPGGLNKLETHFTKERRLGFQFGIEISANVNRVNPVQSDNYLIGKSDREITLKTRMNWHPYVGAHYRMSDRLFTTVSIGWLFGMNTVDFSTLDLSTLAGDYASKEEIINSQEYLEKKTDLHISDDFQAITAAIRAEYYPFRVSSGYFVDLGLTVISPHRLSGKPIGSLYDSQYFNWSIGIGKTIEVSRQTLKMKVFGSGSLKPMGAGQLTFDFIPYQIGLDLGLILNKGYVKQR